MSRNEERELDSEEYSQELMIRKVYSSKAASREASISGSARNKAPSRLLIN